MTSQEWLGCAEVIAEEDKVSGVPILKGSRVQADAVVENYQAGETPNESRKILTLNCIA